MFEKKIKITMIIFISIFLTGCSNNILPIRMEINDLLMIVAIGVDNDPEDPNKICITIASKNKNQSQSGASGDSAESQSIIISNSAATFFEAEREFQTYTDKRMFWGHVSYYLIGEDAARSGIAKYIDFLCRDHETRGSSKVYIVEGTTARNLIEQSSTGDYFIADHLKSIGNNSQLIMGTQELALVEFMEWINSKYSCAIAPTIHLQSPSNEVKEGNKPPMNIDLGGYAIFKDLKLVHIIDKALAKGENFLLNRVSTGVIEVKDPYGEMVGLEIINSHANIKPCFEKGVLKKIDVKVKFSTNVEEVHSTKSIFTKDILEFLTLEQSNFIKAQMENVITFAQSQGLDFIDIATVFEVKHPVLWANYKDKWEDIFPVIPINVEVKSKINRTYDIREPNGVVEEEHEQ